MDHFNRVFLKVFMMEDLLRLVMTPLDSISNGSKNVVHPESSKSDFKSLYFLYFKRWADSIFFLKLDVSSNMWIYFEFLSTITISGLEFVINMSGGFVPPFILWIGRSEHLNLLFYSHKKLFLRNINRTSPELFCNCSSKMASDFVHIENKLHY